MLLKKLLPPPEGDVEKFIKETIKDDLERLNNNLDLFEDWIEHQSYMPKNIDRSILQSVLQGCKFNLDEAKRKFPLFLYYRQTMPDLFTFPKLISEEEKIKAKSCFIGTMPNITPEGNRVAVITCNSQVELMDLNILARYSWNQYTLRITREELYLGDIFILDCSNLKVSHLTFLLDPLVKKSLIITSHSVPIRIKAVYIINAPSYAYKLISMLSPFTSSKIRERIVIDTGMDLLKKIPSECIPKDFGGTGMAIEDLKNLWWECLEEEKEWFESFSEFKIMGELPKHLEESSFKDDMIGVQGSFRKLVID